MERLAQSQMAKTLFAVSFALMVLGSYAQRFLGQNRDLHDMDFYVYYVAAQVVHQDPKADIYAGATDGNPQMKLSPYDSDMSRMARADGHGGIEMYLYPPLLADLLSPLAHLSPERSAKLWRVLNFALILATALLLTLPLRIRAVSLEFVALLVAAYAFLPIVETIPLGQITIVMMALWAVGVCAYADQRVALSAVALAIATCLKITPVLLVPLFLIWNDRRWLAIYAAAIACMVAIMAIVNGWGNLATFTHVISAMGGSVPTSLNRCLSSLISWIYYGHFIPIPSAGEVLPIPPRTLALLCKATSLLVYALCLGLAWRQRRNSDPLSRATTIALFAAVAVIVAPVSWRHGYSVVFIPLALLWAQSLRQRTNRIRPLLLALTTLSIGTVFLEVLVQSARLPQGLRIIAAGIGMLSCLALCLEVLGTATNSDRPSPMHTI